MKGTCALDVLTLSSSMQKFIKFYNNKHAMGSGVTIDDRGTGTCVAMATGSLTYRGRAAWVEELLKIPDRRSDFSLRTSKACGPAT